MENNIISSGRRFNKSKPLFFMMKDMLIKNEKVIFCTTENCFSVINKFKKICEIDVKLKKIKSETFEVKLCK